MVSNFFVVSLELSSSKYKKICFNAKEVNNAISECFKAEKNSIKNTDKKSYISITKYVVTNKEIVEDLWQDEFIQMYFDNVEWVIDGIKEIEKINIPIFRVWHE